MIYDIIIIYVNTPIRYALINAVSRYSFILLYENVCQKFNVE